MIVASYGLVCPVGHSAAAACAAFRAKVANFSELPYCDNWGASIIGAKVPGVSLGKHPGDRLVLMLARAVKECLREVPRPALGRLPFIVGLAEPGRPGSVDLSDTVRGATEARLGIRFHPGLSACLPRGHVSGFEGLRAARELLRSGAAPAVVVCGADSYLNATSLLWLEQQWRLKTLENSDGVIPGEGAAAVLLRPDPATPGEIALRIVGLGFGFEESHVMTEEPFLGKGLAQATQGALAEAGLRMHEIDWRISDVTGESYGFREQSLTIARTMRVRREDLPLWHWGEVVGDVGAASGLFEVVAADSAFRKGYAPGDRAICFTSSVLGDRAVAVVAHGGGSPPPP
jgi:3-oxoacyl-[acyl-carrier-protein] synthase-1